jgi:hypothetical protein
MASTPAAQGRVPTWASSPAEHALPGSWSVGAEGAPGTDLPSGLHIALALGAGIAGTVHLVAASLLEEQVASGALDLRLSEAAAPTDPVVSAQVRGRQGYAPEPCGFWYVLPQQPQQ